MSLSPLVQTFLNSKEFNRLLTKGRDQSFITPEEINDAIPAGIILASDIDAIMNQLIELKIEIQDLQFEKYDLHITGFNDAEIAKALADGLNTEENNTEEEWQDMPEFKQEDETSWRRIIVHFDSIY